MQKINFKQLILEFFVVVIGVALALAADSWRQTLSEGKLEVEYLERINSDLTRWASFIEDQIQRHDMALAGTSFLIQYLENPNGQKDSLELFHNFTNAAATGSNRSSEWIQDSTYQELLSTGRLNIIRDPSLRTDIVNYYRNVTHLAEIKSEISLYIWVIYRELTGANAFRFVRTGTLPEEKIIERLIQELESNENILRELRLLKSHLVRIIENAEDVLEENEILANKLQNNI